MRAWAMMALALLGVALLGGCGLAHGVLVRSVALDSCPVPPGGKRVAADDLWTVMWNQKQFHAKVASPMSDHQTRRFYVNHLLARGWKIDHEIPPDPERDYRFIGFERGTPWESLIRWNYQQLDVFIQPISDGTCLVEFHGTFEYAPLTWPRYLVAQGLTPLALPLYPLVMVPHGEIIGQTICMPVVICVVFLL